MTYVSIHAEILTYANEALASVSRRYFKTGPGDYGEGDQFLGLAVPTCRTLAKQFADLSLTDTTELLQSPLHEERLIALFILVRQFEHGTEEDRKTIFDLYLANSRSINNWDLVDSSAPQIVGGYLFSRDRAVLRQLADSTNLWERRIAILASYFFIKQNDFSDTLKIAAQLLTDSHDLIHKAVGWMLREVGNRSLAPLESFLEQYAPRMPRTMLRYAIEKLPTARRRHYLQVKGGK